MMQVVENITSSTLTNTRPMGTKSKPDHSALGKMGGEAINKLIKSGKLPKDYHSRIAKKRWNPVKRAAAKSKKAAAKGGARK